MPQSNRRVYREPRPQNIYVTNTNTNKGFCSCSTLFWIAVALFVAYILLHLL